VLKNQFIWKNKQNHLMFPLKSSFFSDVRGPHVARVFETPALKAEGGHI